MLDNHYHNDYDNDNMKPRYISTDELRFNFSKVLEAVKRRQSLILTYRKTPLARIEPIVEEAEAPPVDDPFFSLIKIAKPLGKIGSEEIDSLVYEC